MVNLNKLNRCYVWIYISKKKKPHRINEKKNRAAIWLHCWFKWEWNEMRNKELVDNIFSYIARLLAVSLSCRVARLHICKLQMTAHCQQCSIHCVIIFQISDINLGDLICMFVEQVNVYLLSAFLMVSNQKRPMHEKKHSQPCSICINIDISSTKLMEYYNE